MKKILCMLATMLLVMTTMYTMPVVAADAVDVTVDISLYDVDVTVTTNKNGTMTAQLTDENKTVFYGMYSDKATQDDGEYIYEFSFRLPDGTNREAANTGKYRIRLGNNVTVPDTIFTFATLDNRITFYNELNDKTSGDIYNFLTIDRNSYVTVDLTDYSALTGNILNLVNAEIADFGTTYTDIPDGDTATLATVETNFKSAFDSAMTIAKMATVTEAEWADFADDMLDATTFDGKYYVDTEDAAALLDVADVYSYYKTEVEEITVLDSAEYAKAFDKATLHLIEETADYGTFKTAFLYFESDSKNVIAPDMTNIDRLISAGKDTDLWKNVMADSNANCDAVVNNVVAEAQSLIDSGILGSTSSTGGLSPVDKPSAPSGSGTVAGGNTPEIKPVEPSLTGAFSDVEKSHWAYEAIEKMAQSGILNGKGDGKYAPNDGVTREEFVKIIVVAFELKADAENTFADVEADRWSADFIAIAAANGIVTGDGENFNPTNVITRQEMAVIIHRVFNLLEAEVSGDAIAFDDADDIADYAKEAVEALTGAGILNGMGDGSFAPRGTVTRAQSAKVVYELLNLLGGGK